MNNEQLIAAIRDGVPLEEPVSVEKAMMAHSPARAVLASGTGPVSAVHLVNIGVTGWAHNPETAQAYADGFNRGADWTRSAILSYAKRGTPTAAVAAGTIDTPNPPVGIVIADHRAHGWHMQPLIDWERIGAGTMLYTAAAITAASQKVCEEAEARAKKAEEELEEWRFTNRVEELEREVNRLLAQRTAGGDAVAAILRDVAELPDRDSPSDWPEAMLVTAEELREIIERHTAAQPVPEAAAQADAATPAPVSAAPAFSPRDLTKPAEQQGMFEKFQVLRTDGSSAPGGKHHGCAYFVLDLDHDQHAPAAMRAYAASCRATHPELADDIECRFAAPVSAGPQDERAAFEKEANDARFFPREIDFSRRPSPSGRDEYSNGHLQSRWEGWQARASLPSTGAPVSGAEQALLPALKKAAKLLRAAGFTMTGTATSEIVAAINTAESCTVPPAGWQCTRVAGHDGPCAAVPVADVQELPALPEPDHSLDNGEQPFFTADQMRDYARAALATAMRQQKGEVYTCIGKGGVYRSIGIAQGAGSMKLAGKMAIYRDTVSGDLYYREPSDFACRMELVAAKQAGKDAS